MAKRRESQIAAVSQAMTHAHYDVLLLLFLETKNISLVLLFFFLSIGNSDSYPQLSFPQAESRRTIINNRGDEASSESVPDTPPPTEIPSTRRDVTAECSANRKCEKKAGSFEKGQNNNNNNSSVRVEELMNEIEFIRTFTLEHDANNTV